VTAGLRVSCCAFTAPATSAISISWDIVTQQHGGTIAVDSRVGEFTEFAIRLPRARRTIIAAEAAG
jgi:hypothetical protein